MRNPIHMRAVQRAADISGGTGMLARYLHVSPFLIAGWIAGTEEVPPGAFLKIVDIALGNEADPRLRGAIPACEAVSFRHREAANS